MSAFRYPLRSRPLPDTFLDHRDTENKPYAKFRNSTREYIGNVKADCDGFKIDVKIENALLKEQVFVLTAQASAMAELVQGLRDDMMAMEDRLDDSEKKKKKRGGIFSNGNNKQHGSKRAAAEKKASKKCKA